MAKTQDIFPDNGEQLLEEYIPLIISCIKPFLNQNNYDDLLQEAKISFLLSVKGYNPTVSKFTTYIYTCMRNHLINYVRVDPIKVVPLPKHSKYLSYSQPEVFEELLPSYLNPDSIKVIMLRHNGCSYREIAEEFGKSVAWARQRTNRVMRIIKNIEDIYV